MAGTDTSENKTGNVDKDDSAADQKPAKKSRLKLVLALVALLVLAAAAAGGWLVFGTAADTTAEADDAPPVIAVPQKLTYIDLQPIFIQVETDKGELQNVVVALALEVEQGSDTFRRIQAAMPRLYEAYLRTLTGRPLPGAAGGRVEVTHIKNRIRAENLRLLGAGAVYDVVLRNIWVAEG